MERGTSIGGIVRDEQGRPIEGVTVAFYRNGPEDRGREALDFDEITARTDPKAGGTSISSRPGSTSATCISLSRTPNS